MSRIGPRHSSKDNTAGKTKAEKERAEKDRATRSRNAKLNITSRKAIGKKDNPPA